MSKCSAMTKSKEVVHEKIFKKHILQNGVNLSINKQKTAINGGICAYYYIAERL